jgi:hypothetical protein
MCEHFQALGYYVNDIYLEVYRHLLCILLRGFLYVEVGASQASELPCDTLCL